MADEQPRLMLIGLDGGTFELLRPLVEEGLMPHLAELMAGGSRAILRSTVPPFTGAAWSSFITGKNPGGHGVINFRRGDRYNYEATGSGFINADALDYTLWEMLSDNDRRVGVLNVPLTYPPRPVNGFMVTGMLTPAGAATYTYPAPFQRRLGPDYLVDVDFIRSGGDFRQRGFPPKEEMLADIERMTRARLQVGMRLLQEEPWDFFMLVITGTDRISHFFWDDLVSALNVSPSARTAIQKRVLSYFQELDQGIGQMVSGVGSATNVMFMSDHGFGPAPTRRVYVNVWLEKLGLLCRRESDGLFDLEYWRVMLGRQKQLKALLRRFIPESTQSAVKQKTEAASQKSIIGWSRTAAFFSPIYFHVGGVSVNLAGERREGWVRLEDDYEEIRSQIITEARALRDPETGKPIVQRAVRREEIFSGPCVETFPDVILVFDPDYVCAGSLAGSSLIEPHPDPIRPGEHREEGIFIASGPDIAGEQDLSDLELVDVTATVLYSLGVPVPETVEGQALTHIFSPAFQRTHPLQRQPPPAHRLGKRAVTRLSQDEEAQLDERLRGMGYVE